MKLSSLIGLFAAATSVALAQNSSLISNLSSRGLVGSGAGSIIAGFVVEGSAPKNVLVRGTGPGLAAFGDANPAAAVTVNVYNANGSLVATDDGTAPDPNAALAAAAVGAFAQSAQGDSELITALAPGAYTIEIASTSADSPDGDALLEVYDLDAPGSGSTIANLSTRGEVGANAGTMISGFVIGGNTAKNVLIRGIGPELANFGVANTAPAVGIKVYDANGNVVASNQGWMNDPNAAASAQAANTLGAFALGDAGDSAVLVTLPPGAYTVEITPASSDAPDAVSLLEVYDADSAVAAPAG